MFILTRVQLFIDPVADGHHVHRMHPTALRGHEMDPSLRVLHHVLGVADEDLAGVVNVPGEVCAQIETDRQTAVAMDDAHIDDNSGVHGSLDP